MSDSINITLVVWRQKSADDKGQFKEYSLNNIDVNMSFLENH